MPVVIAAIAALGLAVGSFLNVILYRVPRHESIVHPGSHCPHCDHAIRARHNIPVAGWLLLRGKCADCREPISIRYPMIELLSAVAVLAPTMLALRVGLAVALPAYFVAAAAVAAIAIRLRHPVTTFSAAPASAAPATAGWEK
jgi:leader peptidase (prepilin peptidase)/N-methyltransferase